MSGSLRLEEREEKEVLPLRSSEKKGALDETLYKALKSCRRGFSGEGKGSARKEGWTSLSCTEDQRGRRQVPDCVSRRGRTSISINVALPRGGGI